MTVLRVRCSLNDGPLLCQWTLIDPGREPIHGEGPIGELPRHARRVELVILASQVVITRARLPRRARRRGGAVLGYALEEEMLGEPEENQVNWLGLAGGEDVLAVFNRPGLRRWLDALDNLGIRSVEVYCETLLLSLAPGEWSLAWDGYEGFVRSGEIEGAATDGGDRHTPPLSLRLMLEDAAARGVQPGSIAIYITAPDVAPDVEVWQQELGIPLRFAGSWDWRTASSQGRARLLQEQGRSRAFARVGGRLRPAAWIAGIALAIHATALVADWAWLATEQRTLRRQMESRFRAIFPEAVAVTDPALQMRRKLAEARHAAGLSDSADFMPMINHVAAAVKDLPSGSVRLATYELGRITLHLGGLEDAAVRRVAAHLVQTGLRVDVGPASARSANAHVVLTVGGA